MKMMNETERKKMITDVFKFGGIGLRRQSLRVHKNGAKFPISKNYIDDEVLNPRVKYTVILIPEVFIAEKTSIILSFYEQARGFQLIHSYPENSLTPEEQWNILQNFENIEEQEFFTVQSSLTPASLNYQFQIPSTESENEKEILLLSVIINRSITPAEENIILPICQDFAAEVKDDILLIRSREQQQEAFKKRMIYTYGRIYNFYPNE